MPERQLLPLQQPVHDEASQTHWPNEHRCPGAQAPVEHVPPQPSLAPQVTPAQLGTHPALPQRLGPFAPHVRPAVHGPQSRGSPQRPTIAPQYPAQSAARFGVHGRPLLPEAPLLPLLPLLPPPPELPLLPPAASGKST